MNDQYDLAANWKFLPSIRSRPRRLRAVAAYRSVPPGTPNRKKAAYSEVADRLQPLTEAEAYELNSLGAESDEIARWRALWRERKEMAIQEDLQTAKNTHGLEWKIPLILAGQENTCLSRPTAFTLTTIHIPGTSHPHRLRDIVGVRNCRRMWDAAGIIVAKRRERRVMAASPCQEVDPMPRIRQRLAATRYERQQKLEKARRRSEAAKKAAVTRKNNRMLGELPAAVKERCRGYTSEHCEDCSGTGLIYRCSRRHPDGGYECKCTNCGGEGLKWYRHVSWQAVTAAYDAMQIGGSLEEQAQAASEANEYLDAPEEWDGTLVSTWQRNGMIDEDEADAIREKCRRRHEETNYDNLLASGLTKEDARVLSD